MGITVPLGIVYGRNSIRNRITSNKEILNALDVPILSELAYEKSKMPIVVHDRRKFAIAEEFRTLRTKLHYLHGKREKGRVTLLTSSISNEGKSFVATNLAVALAASGRKTIILELDLRKPKVSSIFNLEAKSPGISNYLNGEVSEKEILQSSVTYPNLDVMGSGDFYSNPSELIDQPRMEALINWLRLNYDDIIIDTPPVSIVTDAILLARLSDVTLYIIRQGFTSKILLPFIKNLNTENHFSKMNIIFNGMEKGRYGYSGYGYGYEDYIADKGIKRKYSNSIFKDFFKRF
jgi:capsular exopolysaccharide synthesis family protein